MGRCRDRQNRAVELGADVFDRYRPTVQALLVLLVLRQVRADLLERDATVFRAQHLLRAVIDHTRVLWRRRDRRIPVGPVAQVLRLHAVHILGIRLDLAGAFVVRIVFGQCAVDRGRVDQRRIIWIERDVRAFTTAYREEVITADATVVRLAEDCNRGVILLPAVDSIWKLIVRVDAVELRGRLVHDARPALTAVERDRRAAVVGIDHVLVVVGVDPVIVVIAVWRALLLERHAAID